MAFIKIAFSSAVACLAQFFRSEEQLLDDNMKSTPPSRITFTPENTRGIDVDQATLALPMAQAALDALAALCANLDEARDRVVGDAKLWPLVIEYLGNDDPAMKWSLPSSYACLKLLNARR